MWAHFMLNVFESTPKPQPSPTYSPRWENQLASFKFSETNTLCFSSIKTENSVTVIVSFSHFLRTYVCTQIIGWRKSRLVRVVEWQSAEAGEILGKQQNIFHIFASTKSQHFSLGEWERDGWISQYCVSSFATAKFFLPSRVAGRKSSQFSFGSHGNKLRIFFVSVKNFVGLFRKFWMENKLKLWKYPIKMKIN